MKLLMIFLFITTLCSVFSAKKSFAGYKVYRLKPTSQNQIDLLIELENGDNDYDFWSRTNSVGNPVDVMVSPKDQKTFLALTSAAGMNVKVFIKDVQALISKEKVSDGLGRAGMTWNTYHKLSTIYKWLDSLPASFPGKVSVIKAGQTYENRDIKAVKISFSKGKRAVFLEGGMHAREWISTATVTYLINELLTSTNPAFRKIAESFDWYIVPVSNPDGYEFTHSGARLWRKTMSPQGFCQGADPNRNWNIHWGEFGTSTDPCSEIYGGFMPFSEIETKTLSQFITTIGKEIDVYLAFHSYSQLLLMPYGHSADHLDNYDDVLKIGNATVKALAAKYGTKYAVGNIAETLYPASGGSMDWVKAEFNIPIVLLYELRDTGKYGFILPTVQIIPNCEEVVDSIIAMFDESENLGYFNLG